MRRDPAHQRAKNCTRTNNEAGELFESKKKEEKQEDDDDDSKSRENYRSKILTCTHSKGG